MTIRQLFITTAILTTLTGIARNSELSKDRYELNAKITKLLDNLFINKARIESMMRLRSKLVAILDGELTNGVRVGMFQFQNKKMTLEELLALETEQGNATPEIVDALQQALKTIRTELTQLLGQYARQARGAKPLLVKLIDESLGYRKIRHSLLRNWAKVEDGQEPKQLNRDLTDLRSCRDMCLHLIYFLQDMMFSCKKAFAEYHKYVQQHMHNNQA